MTIQIQKSFPYFFFKFQIEVSLNPLKFTENHLPCSLHIRLLLFIENFNHLINCSTYFDKIHFMSYSLKSNLSTEEIKTTIPIWVTLQTIQHQNVRFIFKNLLKLNHFLFHFDQIELVFNSYEIYMFVRINRTVNCMMYRIDQTHTMV